MNVHDPWRVEGRRRSDGIGSPRSHSALKFQSLLDHSGVRALFVSTYSLPRILKVIINHSILDHTILLLDTVGYGGEWKAGLHLSSSSRLQRLNSEIFRLYVHYFPRSVF